MWEEEVLAAVTALVSFGHWVNDSVLGVRGPRGV